MNKKSKRLHFIQKLGATLSLAAVGGILMFPEVQPHHVEADSKIKVSIAHSKTTGGINYGYLKSDLQDNTTTESARTGVLVKASNLPSSDGSTSKIVKDQRPWGTCWAFSGIGTMEYAADKKESKNHIFSEEMMLRNFTKKSDTGYQLTDKDDGGNEFMAAGYLVSHGAVSSSLLYNAKNSLMELPYMESTKKQTAYRATDVKFFQKDYKEDASLTQDSIEQIKKAVYNNGGVAALANWNYLYIKNDTMNTTDSNARQGLNHAVVIVGWYDDYNKSNFLHTPKDNGAFLVRNSWGDKNGDHGYYWVSYQDRSIVPAYTVEDYEITTPDENIYNLEEGALSPDIKIADYKTAGFVNVFTLNGKEKLDKISFYTDNIGARYQIYYVPVDKTGELQLHDAKAVTDTKTVKYQGYHTQQIKSLVVKQGKVAIMVAMQSAGNYSSIGAEGSFSSETDKLYIPSISKKESYLITNYGIEDMRDEEFGNWTIKMTTKDTDEVITTDKEIKEIKHGVYLKDIGCQKITDLQLDKNDLVYNGKQRYPVTIASSEEDQLLENHKDYTTVYKNNLSIGQASVTIKGKGSFFGTMKKKFWIHPEKVRSLKVKKKGKVTTVSFKKNKGRVTGYKIQYSRRKDMKHSKYLIVRKNRCKIKNQCKVYVRVKAYTQIGKKKIYSLKWAKK